ncbi:MAG: glycosyltransferase [Immundisolibacter sp.]|uniref:glycosyltransferase n=1 Tax=Immundisolibacter sp. TaxID=1934948 RepID=UPI003EDF988F
MTEPRILVFSSLFPHVGAPGAGLFVRERMFRVARRLPLTVVSPQPWFPGQALLRRWRPHFRPAAPRRETQQGITVHLPRFLSVPGLAKSWDGRLMALACYPLLRRLRRQGGFDLIDAHFGYPDGYAASLLGRWLGVPVTVTLRGSESRQARTPALRRRLAATVAGVDRIIAVSDSLRQLALELGVSPTRVEVIGNGVDAVRFAPRPRLQARAALGIAPDSPVLVSVGTLVERKGFHRVIALLPALRQSHPGLIYLVVGGGGPEGDMSGELRTQVAALGLEDAVQFLGPLAPDELSLPLSAADVFVLASRNEGWANVLLEAMACGLPVVATDVGGNAEVVCRQDLGCIVPFGDAAMLQQALVQALGTDWDRPAIRRHAEDHAWDGRVDRLVGLFQAQHLTGQAS